MSTSRSNTPQQNTNNSHKARYISWLLIPLFALAFYLYLQPRPEKAGETILMSTKPSMENLNVLKKPLALFSKQPLTGFFRDGYCRTGPGDAGNHAIAGVVNSDFLSFSASRGNDLRQIGLTDGCKWCLCTARWKEALDAARKGEISETAVPKVFLHATDQSALQNGVSMEDLKKFAAEGEASNASTAPQQPGARPSAPIKEA